MSKNILNQFSLKITKGSKIGIHGESGSGKSTFIDILLGLIKPNAGSIYVDDVQLDDSKIENWQENFSQVSQSSFVMDCSIIDNIGFGQENIDIEKVKLCCKLACLEDFIDDLPLGYDTIVGENGYSISGGQCQRIAVARSLYRSSPILILDEATNALDEKTELNVIKNICSINGLTLILISHNLKLLEFCDYNIDLLKLNEYNN